MRALLRVVPDFDNVVTISASNDATRARVASVRLAGDRTAQLSGFNPWELKRLEQVNPHMLVRETPNGMGLRPLQALLGQSLNAYHGGKLWRAGTKARQFVVTNQ
jgi:hypothetical protein